MPTNNDEIITRKAFAKALQKALPTLRERPDGFCALCDDTIDKGAAVHYRFPYEAHKVCVEQVVDEHTAES